jgi:hypothetical protein
MDKGRVADMGRGSGVELEVLKVMVLLFGWTQKSFVMLADLGKALQVLEALEAEVVE